MRYAASACSLAVAQSAARALHVFLQRNCVPVQPQAGGRRSLADRVQRLQGCAAAETGSFFFDTQVG